MRLFNGDGNDFFIADSNGSSAGGNLNAIQSRVEVVGGNGVNVMLVNDEGRGMAGAQKAVLPDVARQSDTFHAIVKLSQAGRQSVSLGGGDFKMMKDLSSPIHVNGKHWGGVRLAYTF